MTSAVAASDRRALRAGVQGVHPGHGQGRLRRAGSRASAQPLHHRHPRRRDAHEPRRTIRRFSIEAVGHRASRLLRAWVRTAPSAPTRTRSRSSARRRTTTRRATSSTTRRSPGSVTVSHLRFGPRPIRAPYLIDRRRLRRLPPVRVPRAPRRAGRRRAGRGVPRSTARTGRTRSGSTCPAPVQADDHRQAAAPLRHRRRTGSRATTGMGGRVNTIMQTCFFAISGVLPREEAIAAIKHSIEKTYGKRGEAVVQQELRGRRRHAGAPARGASAGRGRPATSSRRLPVPAGGARVRPAVSRAPMIAGEGDRLPVSALPVDGTYPSGHDALGETQHRARDSRLGRDALHPVRQVRARLSARRDPRQGLPAELVAGTRRRAWKSAPARWRSSRTTRYTLQVSPEDCTGCALCVEVCPAKRQERGAAQGHQHGAAAAAGATREARNWDFFLGSAGGRNAARSTRARSRTCSSSQPLFEFSGRVRGLRRDALSQAAEPALRRPRRSSPTPPAARRSTAATCRRRPGPPTARVAGPPGPTRCSRTTPSSVWACVWRWTSRASTRASC